MGKYNTRHKRVARDLYQTIDRRPIAALAEHFNFAGREIWEFAAGQGYMVRDMRRLGARVFASDIVRYDGFKLDAIYDFTSNKPAPTSFRNPVSNPPLDFEKKNRKHGDGKLAEACIAAGLRHIGRRGVMALLLPCDFDSAARRWKYFGGCDAFAAKLVLCPGRIVWFDDGIKKPAPQENRAWFLWSLRMREQLGAPELRYARVGPYQRRSQETSQQRNRGGNK
jgi:hypothetical protein